MLQVTWKSCYHDASYFCPRSRQVQLSRPAAGWPAWDLGQVGKAKAVKHHEALAYRELPEFIAKLRRRRGRTQQSELTALAVEWTSYNEVHGCTDAEIDWERRLWTIPARGMKASREHVVPLSDRLRPVHDMAMWRTPTGTRSVVPRVRYGHAPPVPPDIRQADHAARLP
jgi:integrase